MTVQAMSLEARRSATQQLGKYQLVATLGQGGMGTVYLVLASGFGEFRKLLVVKELRQDLTRQEGFVSMFMDEAKLAARLAHPNVVQTFEATEIGDRYFLAMEYLDGQSLSALLERLSKSPTGKLSLWMQLQILCEALAGLHYAHELLDYDGSSLQVVHRDVSPQNVFVTYHGQVKVVDFGVAKVANASVQTAPGVFVGKFTYAAPEQVVGNPVDARTDVFAVGVMLWQAIADRPFCDQAPSPAACRARAQGMEPRISEVVPGVDPELARICDRALAVDPDERFTSAKEFRSQLQEYMQRSGVRVEAAEIGQLMQEVFDGERRSLHARIEQAMRNTGSTPLSAEDLSIFHVDKVPTTVADLSSLVEISQEHDDHKIQQGYAHSKVTLVRPPSEKRGRRMATFVRTPQGRLLTISGSCLLVLIAALWLMQDRTPERVHVQPLAPVASSTPVAPVPPKPAPPPLIFPTETSVSAATKPPAAKAPAIEPSATVSEPKPVAMRKTRAALPTPPVAAAPMRSSSKPRPLAVRPLPEVATPDPPPVLVTTPEPAGPRKVEEGSDLVFIRRAPAVRIDRENPYQ